jgi:hypothetical protein
MRVGYLGLRDLLNKNVLDVQFIRRRPKAVSGARRMICTNCPEILNSMEGRLVLNYRPTSRPPNYNPALKNLIIVWDILWQDYRQISVETCDVVQVIPADKFWEYFKENLANLNPVDKQKLMDI